jgi:hypothetical protein
LRAAEAAGMAYVVTPATVARNRYQRCFASNIFDAPDSPKVHQYPAGKRRDQTVGELFGDEQEGKNLKFQQGTFVPKDDGRSAREKKQDFLTSTVLPSTAHDFVEPEEPVANGDNPWPREFSTDPVARRLQENTSNIFTEGGGQAPTDADAHTRWAENKLRPTSFRWYQVPGDSADAQEDSAAVRALHEKRSTVFDEEGQAAGVSDRAAVQARHEEEQIERRLEHEADEKRRANCYYSDLFGRPTPMAADVGRGGYPKRMVAPEDRITVHGDWSDARTEIERGAAKPNRMTPADRKLEEFHVKDSVFGHKDIAQEFVPPPITQHLQMPDVMDNSKKVGRKEHDTKTIHQAHMQSSVVDREFYETAAQRTSWEVAEVHVSGLAREENNETIGKKVKAAGFHVIRVNAAMDPVNNTCKGTCRLQVRYNPNAREHPVGSLLRTLEEKYGLRGEM